MGEIKLFAGTFAPKGWMLCSGQLMSISQNSALFSLIGNYYGGDGQVTFALPNLQGRVPIHAGQGPGTSRYEIGQIGGSESVTLTTQQMPAHTHSINCSSTANQPIPGSFYPAASSDPAIGTVINSYSSTTDSQMNPAAVIPTGGSQPVLTVPPYLAMYYIIAIEGIYPSRP